MLIFSSVGSVVLGFFADTGRGGLLLFRILGTVPAIPRSARLIIRQMFVIGNGSIPLVLITSVFTGAVATVQAKYQFQAYVPLGFLGTVVAKSVVIELGPVLTALVVGSRVGSSIAAELGTMRVTEQVDALETLAYNPTSYLVVPRVLAATVMFPVVVSMAMTIGVLSGYVTAVNLLDLSTVEFVRGLRLFYQFKDIWFGLVKAMSFGFAIGLIGCVKGLGVRRGAQEVGRATTEAVVLGAQLILVLDAFWAVVLL